MANTSPQSKASSGRNNWMIVSMALGAILLIIVGTAIGYMIGDSGDEGDGTPPTRLERQQNNVNGAPTNATTGQPSSDQSGPPSGGGQQPPPT